MFSRFLAVTWIAAAFFAVPFFAASAATPSYQASGSGGTVRLQPGESKTVTLTFTNVGTETWVSGTSRTALYLYGRSSLFSTPSWKADDLPAVLTQASVKPGQVATVTFSVRAPKSSGTYTERYLLSTGPNQWMKGSVVSVTYVVAGATASAPSTPVTPVATPVASSPSAGSPSAIVSGSAEYQAVVADRGGLEWQMDPQGQATVSIAFQNTGTATWSKTSANYVSLYTGKDNRKSSFKDSSWKSDTQVTVLQETSVKPGGIGHFTFYLRAPTAPGSYQESFQLAAENKAWISGGVITIPVRVTASSNPVIASNVVNGVDTSVVEAAPAAGVYQTTMLLSSVKNVTLLGNGRQSLTFGFKNIGSASWSSMTLRLAGVTPALGVRLAGVRDESWMDASVAASTVKDTAPGQIGFIGFTLKAPAKKGNYNARFTLYANNQPVDGGVIDIPITVTADGYIEPEPVAPKPTTSNSSGSSVTTQPSAPTLIVPAVGGDVNSLPDEPIIRVGLFKTTDDSMVIGSVSGDFVLNQAGSTVCRFTNGQTVTVSYSRSSGLTTASGSGCSQQTSSYFQLVATDGISPLRITDFNRPVSWLPGANDNTFRGKLELRYAKATDTVWIINELPIEWYLKGIGETSNSSPQQYQRALLTAARTYAMYHVQRSTKHAAENFIVDATYDQVYRGFGAEARDPNVVTAVDATRGQIVTYQGKLAITPYYSRSDGRTRSWTEVWGGGPYPWLVSVPVPWDNGKTLWGHGVGMSATGALGAAADGWTYDKILALFYQGSSLGRIYK